MNEYFNSQYALPAPSPPLSPPSVSLFLSPSIQTQSVILGPNGGQIGFSRRLGVSRQCGIKGIEQVSLSPPDWYSCNIQLEVILDHVVVVLAVRTKEHRRATSPETG